MSEAYLIARTWPFGYGPTLFLMSRKIKAIPTIPLRLLDQVEFCTSTIDSVLYEGWNFNSGNYLFTTDTK